METSYLFDKDIKYQTDKHLESSPVIISVK